MAAKHLKLFGRAMCHDPRILFPVLFWRVFYFPSWSHQVLSCWLSHRFSVLSAYLSGLRFVSELRHTRVKCVPVNKDRDAARKHFVLLLFTQNYRASIWKWSVSSEIMCRIQERGGWDYSVKVNKCYWSSACFMHFVLFVCPNVLLKYNVSKVIHNLQYNCSKKCKQTSPTALR